MKNWKTTLGAVIGAILVVLGFFFPDQLDVETQVVIVTATGEIIAGIGVLIGVVTGIFAKDPE